MFAFAMAVLLYISLKFPIVSMNDGVFRKQSINPKLRKVKRSYANPLNGLWLNFLLLQIIRDLF